MIEIFRWSPDFETGIGVIDAQHARLVELINEAGPQLADEDLAEEVQREGLLDELIAYSQHHFAEEERLMDETGLDAGFVADHVREHRAFLAEVLAMRRHIDAGRPRSVDVLRFLTNWLTSHILGVDQVMAEQVALRRDGHSSTDAFTRARTRVGDASRPLLDALTALYQMVSRRNRELREANQFLEAKVSERTAELQRNAERLRESEARLRELSVTDPLTGLPNRRRLDEVLQAEFQRAERFGTPVSVVLADIDHFKDVNDAHGHDVGDSVLCAFATLLGERIREVDLVARIGGEEFVIVMPGASAGDAVTAADRLRSGIRTLRVDGFPGALTASFGVATLRRGDSLHSLLRRADGALYRAKHDGRDCVRQEAEAEGAVTRRHP